MKKITYLILLITSISFAQNPEAAEKMVIEGVHLHDEGKYNQALAKYDEALKTDKDNFFALAEKAMTLVTIKNYKEAIKNCEKVLKLYPNENLAMLYVTYGNALDLNNEAQKAIQIYDEGIQKYPNLYQLYYNKAIALAGLNDYEQAEINFQNATFLNPNHPSSFNALGTLNHSNRVAAILAICRYLAIDNTTPRSELNIKYLLELMNQGVEKSEPNQVNITLNDLFVRDESVVVANDFSSVDLMLSMGAAYEMTTENKYKTDVEKFSDRLKTIFSSLESSSENQTGYYWEYLAPYFIEMKKQDLVNTFANIAFAAKNDNNAINFLKNYPDKIDAFYQWSDEYTW